MFLLPTLCSVKSLILHVQMSPLLVHGGLSLISWSLISRVFSPHIRESGIRQNFCLWNPESGTLVTGIQLKESVHPLTIRIQNPSSTEKDRSQCLESGIHGVDSRSKTLFYIPLPWAVQYNSPGFPFNTFLPGNFPCPGLAENARKW